MRKGSAASTLAVLQQFHLLPLCDCPNSVQAVGLRAERLQVQAVLLFRQLLLYVAGFIVPAAMEIWLAERGRRWWLLPLLWDIHWCLPVDTGTLSLEWVSKSCLQRHRSAGEPIWLATVAARLAASAQVLWRHPRC